MSTLFKFEDLADSGKAMAAFKKIFSRRKLELLKAEPGRLVTMGDTSYKEVHLTFAGGQTAELRVKPSGEIFQAKANGKIVQLKNHDDHTKAVAELVNALGARKAIPLFDFEDLANETKALGEFKKIFAEKKLDIANVEVGKLTRRMGVSYKEVRIGFSDSQVVTFCVKQTGDIFQVKVNGKAVPIKEQEDQAKVVEELVGMMDANRAAIAAKARVDKPQVPDAEKKKAKAASRKTHKQKVEALQAANKAAQDALAQLNAEVSRVEGQKADLEKIIADMEGEIAQMDAEFADESEG